MMGVGLYLGFWMARVQNFMALNPVHEVAVMRSAVVLATAIKLKEKKKRTTKKKNETEAGSGLRINKT